MRGHGEQQWPADSGPDGAARGTYGTELLRPLYYVPGLLLVLLAGLPFVFVLSEPSRFLAGQSATAEGGPEVSVEAQVQRLQERVERLEARLTAVAANPVLDLGGRVRLIPAGDAPATLRFEGVDLEIVNRRGTVLETQSAPRR